MVDFIRDLIVLDEVDALEGLCINHFSTKNCPVRLLIHNISYEANRTPVKYRNFLDSVNKYKSSKKFVNEFMPMYVSHRPRSFLHTEIFDLYYFLYVLIGISNTWFLFNNINYYYFVNLVPVILIFIVAILFFRYVKISKVNR